jgi:shikimate kinase
MVLSTGGGVVLRPENRAALRQGFSHVMYLRASPDEIYKRVRHARRGRCCRWPTHRRACASSTAHATRCTARPRTT